MVPNTQFVLRFCPLVPCSVIHVAANHHEYPRCSGGSGPTIDSGRVTLLRRACNVTWSVDVGARKPSVCLLGRGRFCWNGLTLPLGKRREGFRRSKEDPTHRLMNEFSLLCVVTVKAEISCTLGHVVPEGIGHYPRCRIAG